MEERIEKLLQHAARVSQLYSLLHPEEDPYSREARTIYCERKEFEALRTSKAFVMEKRNTGEFPFTYETIHQGYRFVYSTDKPLSAVQSNHLQ